MSGVNKRKASGNASASTTTAASASASNAPTRITENASGASVKKRKTEAGKGNVPAVAAAPVVLDDAELLCEYESSILLGADSSSESSIAQHYNTLLKIIAIADKLINNNNNNNSIRSLSADSISICMSSIQSLVRIFSEWLMNGQFVLSKIASKKSGQKTQALQTLHTLFVTQYKKVWSIIFILLQCDVEVVQSNALHAAMDLVQAEGMATLNSSAASADPSASATAVAESLANGSFQSLIRCVMLSDSLSASTRKEFNETFLSKHADLRWSAFQQIRGLVALSGADWNGMMREWKSSGVAHIVTFMLHSDWSGVLTKNWIILPEIDPDEEDLMAMPTSSTSSTATPAALQKLFGECWMGILKQKLSVELYKEILVSLHATIIPTLVSPLMLSDFLTDSYNIGGIVSLLALNGLFILISKYNLDYPSFFKKLYACCKPYVFHAKYRARFFQLVALFLTSSYLPSYLVCAFTKRFARLSLTAPPSGTIFCIALIYNMLRRHPICRPLINRQLLTTPAAKMAQKIVKGESKAATEILESPKPQNVGILSSLLNLQQARVTMVKEGKMPDEDDEDDDDTGLDPFLSEIDDPEQSNASNSSLWEIESLTNHFEPTVSNLAKVFFTTHAPKKDLEMNKYIQQSYETLFTKETDRRSNQKVALQPFQKYSGLFSDSAGSIGLTFELPKPSFEVPLNSGDLE